MRRGMLSRGRGLTPLSPLLPLLLSLARAATPPPHAAPNAAPRQLLVQMLQSAVPSSPLQALQSVSRPLQSLQSQLPVRPLQTLQGWPAVTWLQNSRPVIALQTAAASLGSTMPSASGRRRRRSVDSDVAEQVAEGVAEDLLGADMVVEPTSGDKQSTRQEKALQYLSGGYLAVGPPGSDFSLDLDDAGITLAEEDGNELLSRAAPYRNRNRNQPDSPIYYIRLPPSPYVLVPGMGYVSSPGRRPLGSLGAPPPPPPASSGSSPFYNLPLTFMSNGKPTGVYQPAWAMPQQRPQQPSPMFSLNKGPYVFNGRPSDIFILRDSYDTLYGDTLSSFYP